MEMVLYPKGGEEIAITARESNPASDGEDWAGTYVIEIRLGTEADPSSMVSALGFTEQTLRDFSKLLRLILPPRPFNL